jgi:lysyl-tRNA synthetase class 2
MTRVHVYTALDSSVLAAATYAPDGILELEFRTRTVYRYFAVPPAVFQDLIAAPSKGKYFNRNIRNHFRHQRVA